MRKFVGLLIVIVFGASAHAQTSSRTLPISVGSSAQRTTTHIAFADAEFLLKPACGNSHIEKGAQVFLGKTESHGPNVPPELEKTLSIMVTVYTYDYCAGTYAYAWGRTTPRVFFLNGTDVASVKEDVTVMDSTTGISRVVAVNILWQEDGLEENKGEDRNSHRVPTQKTMNYETSVWVHAQVSGSVMDGQTEFMTGTQYGSISDRDESVMIVPAS